MGVTLKTCDIVTWRLLILTIVKLAHGNVSTAATVKPLVENSGIYVYKLVNVRFVHGNNISAKSTFSVLILKLGQIICKWVLFK